MSLHRTVALVAAITMAATLAACSDNADSDLGSGAPATGASQGPEELVVWGRSGSADGIEQAVNKFNEAQDAYVLNLTIIPNEQYNNKLATSVRGGSGPDIASFDDINAPLFAASGTLLDITERVNSLPYKDDLDVGQLGLATYMDKVYGIPAGSGPSVMLWNKDLFEQAGLDPDNAPSTWDDIMTAAKAVAALGDDINGFKIPGNCGGCFAYTVFPLIWASGGDVLTEPSEDQSGTLSTSAPVAEALEFYRDLWDAGVSAPADQVEDGSTWGQSFNAGKTGIWFGFPSNATEAEAQGVNVGSAPIPGKDGDFSTFAGGDVIGIMAQTTHADAAWEFFKWYLSDEQQKDAVASGTMPARTDMSSVVDPATQPLLATMLEAATKGRATDSVAASAITNDASAPWLWACQQIIFQKADPATALAEADSQINELIKSAYGAIGG